MQICECKDENAWVETVNLWLAEAVERCEARRVFVPAGETPRPLYRSWQENGLRTSLSSLKLVQLDEVMTPDKPFRQFFLENLPRFKNDIEFIDTAEKGADIAMLGLGLNGHVAFHEPGLPETFYSGCIELTAETLSRLKLPPRTRGLTYGLSAFLRSKAVAMLVRGESKRGILREVLSASCMLPAAKILRHRDATLITDFKI